MQDEIETNVPGHPLSLAWPLVIRFSAFLLTGNVVREVVCEVLRSWHEVLQSKCVPY